MTWFHIYALSTPLLVFLLAMGVVALTNWQDQRALQREAQVKRLK